MSKVTPFGWLFIFLTITLTVAGQILVKKGMLQVGASPAQLALLPRFIWKTFTNLTVLAGLGCALLAAVCWTVAVSRSDLSVAYPFVGLGIVLVLALSGVVFGEVVPLNRWIGVGVVCLGLAIAARH